MAFKKKKNHSLRKSYLNCCERDLAKRTQSPYRIRTLEESDEKKCTSSSPNIQRVLDLPRGLGPGLKGGWEGEKAGRGGEEKGESRGTVRCAAFAGGAREIQSRHALLLRHLF